MKTLTLTLLSVALALSFSVAEAAKPAPKNAKKGAAAKKIYCWEENGKRMCGDTLPSSAMDQARTEVSSKTGLTTKKVDRVLTPEEIQAAARAEKSSQTQAQLQAVQAQRVQLLLFTYPTEEALVLAQKEQETDILTKIKEAEGGVREVRKAILERLKILAEYELGKKKIPQKEVDNVKQLRGRVEAHHGVINGHKQQLAALRATHAENVALYRQAKAAAQAPSAPAATAATP